MTTTTKLSELTGDYVLDTAQTRIGFVARRTMATKVPGQFGEFAGSTHLDGDDPSKSSAELTIQAKSIQTRNQQRDQALRSKFLDMDNHRAVVVGGGKRLFREGEKATLRLLAARTLGTGVVVLSYQPAGA